MNTLELDMDLLYDQLVAPRDKPTVIALRGLPASGKTTLAIRAVEANLGMFVHVSRDMIGNLLNNGRRYDLLALDAEDHRDGEDNPGQRLFDATEKSVTRGQKALIREMLLMGRHVIVDDTNLRRRVARELRDVAALAGADFEIIDLADQPLDLCLKRNEYRLGTQAYVPPSEIRRKHANHIACNRYEIPLAPDPVDGAGAPYVPLPELRETVLVDIDGTVALMDGRSPYDWHRVHLDRPNMAVIRAVLAMYVAGHDIIFCSGRDAVCREATEAWLDKHVGIPYEALYMRPEGNTEKDSVIKLRIFNENIRRQRNVVGVFDDRNQVVEMWRSLGLTVFQVAEGKF